MAAIVPHTNISVNELGTLIKSLADSNWTGLTEFPADCDTIWKKVEVSGREEAKPLP